MSSFGFSQTIPFPLSHPRCQPQSSTPSEMQTPNLYCNSTVNVKVYRQIYRQSMRARGGKRRQKREGEAVLECGGALEREIDEELNASSYPRCLTALKPFHNFLFPFLSELCNIQNMCGCVCVCIYRHAQVICFCCVPLQECVLVCAWKPLCVCVS